MAEGRQKKWWSQLIQQLKILSTTVKSQKLARLLNLLNKNIILVVKTLYHASQQKKLKVLSPQPTKSHNKYIGDYLFATKNFTLALMYLTPKGISILMEPNDDSNIIICSNEKSFTKIDKGGAIYSLPADKFMDSPQKDISDYEMVSTAKVEPIKVKIYDSVLVALMSAGIKVRFVNPSLFKDLIGNPTQKELIATLPLYQPK